jgi:hypothetical protein
MIHRLGTPCPAGVRVGLDGNEVTHPYRVGTIQEIADTGSWALNRAV